MSLGLRLCRLQLHPWLGRALLVLCCALVSFSIYYPGNLNPDSTDQMRQALSGRFTDWHPPIMAALWRLLSNVASGQAPMLAFQVGLYWLGVWAILDACRDCRGWRVLLVFAPALHPLLLVLMGYVLKDVSMASALIAAFGLLFRQRAHGRPISPLVAVAVALLLGYAALVRSNGVFAVPALLVYWFRPVRFSPAGMIAATGLFVAIAVPVSSMVNHRLLNAERTGVEASPQLFDLAGIAHFTGDEEVLELPAGCYTPFHWDPLRTPACANQFEKFTEGMAAAERSLTLQWLTAIGSHPLAFARHRLAHFNSSTYFLVPPAHRCRSAPEYHGCDVPRARLYVTDFIRKSAPYWPCIWLAAGAWLLFQRSAGPASLALAWSGMTYGFGYLLVGVATDYRYNFWTTLSIGMGVGLHLSRSEDLFTSLKSLAVPVGLVAIAGYAARIWYVLHG